VPRTFNLQDSTCNQKATKKKRQSNGPAHRVRSAIAPYADDPAAPILTFEKLTLETMDQLRRQITATVIEAGR
jgi:hypothetical protein